MITVAKKIFLLCCLLGFAINVYSDDGSIAAGKSKATSCAVCHGPDGNASNPIWPKLAGQNAPYLSKQLLDFKLGATGGRNNPIMTSLTTNLTKADIADLSAYYASLPRTIGAAQPQMLELGQHLYRGGDLARGIPACAACHEPDGLGNPPAAFPALSGQNAGYVVEQLIDFRNGTRSNDPNQMMHSIAGKMNDQEINAVASYIAGLHRGAF